MRDGATYKCTGCGKLKSGYGRCQNCGCNEFYATRPSERREDGLTESEGEVVDALVTAWNKFSGLERQHPDELRDFMDAIHRCQDLLAVRIARREYPKG